MFCYWWELAVSIIPHIISEVFQYHSISYQPDSNWASSQHLHCRHRYHQSHFLSLQVLSNWKGLFWCIKKKLKVVFPQVESTPTAPWLPELWFSRHFQSSSIVVLRWIIHFDKTFSRAIVLICIFRKKDLCLKRIKNVLVKPFVIGHRILISITPQALWLLAFPIRHSPQLALPSLTQVAWVDIIKSTQY